MTSTKAPEYIGHKTYIREIQFDKDNNMIVVQSDGKKIDCGYFRKDWSLIIEKDVIK